jgi:class III poly(R)-hydroxyalkanoic acid synthase PhaE subunit
VNDDPWSGWQAFNDAARSYLERLSKPNAAATAAQGFSDFLREQFSAAIQPWHVGGAGGAPGDSMPPWWMPAGPSAANSETPAFGATREHQQRAQRMAEAARRMQAAQRRLQRLWSDVLAEAAGKFVTQMTAAAPMTASPEVVRRLYDTWIECAEDAYARTAHGEAFCQAQAELTNAASQWRQEQQANIERWCKWLDLPTRSEVNSLTQRLRALEQRVRDARDGRDAPPAQPNPKPPAPASANTSKAAKRPKRKS